MNKFERAAELVAQRVSGTITMLDVGCRKTALKPYVERFGEYKGADLFANPGVDYVGDFSQGLPVPEQAFDVTFALDVLEHTDDIQKALDELMRVTRQFSIIILPNFAQIPRRITFLLKGSMGTDKYDLRFPTGRDRHRWLTTAEQSDAYMRDYCKERGYTVEMVPSKIGRWRHVESVFARFSPDLWVRHRMYVVSRPVEARSKAAA
jgi:SAM-dependent methyltransferase